MRYLLLLTLFLPLALPTSAAAESCPTINGVLDTNCDGKLLIVTFGDSITKGRGDRSRLGYPGRLSKLLPNARVVRLAVSGETTDAGLARAKRQFRAFDDADWVIILQGTNDYYDEDGELDRTKENLLKIVELAKNTGAITLLGSLTATTRVFQRAWIDGVNRRIKPFISISFFKLGTGIIGPDGLHPNGTGYQRMARLVARVLKRETAERLQ